ARATFLREVGGFVLACGPALAAAACAVWFGAVAAGADVATQRTLLLSVLVLAGLGIVLLLSEGNRWLKAWAGCALVVYGLAMYLPWPAAFFELTPLSLGQWLIVTPATTAALVICTVYRRGV